MDIVIYTNPDTLEVKKGEAGEGRFYWWLSRTPLRFKVGDKIYFAVRGYVVGHFVCEEFNPNHYEEIVVWDSHSWVELKEKVPTKPFRGFRYRWWELKEV